ncbi:hypothetical protein Mlute_00166 [Meiothermus luteus]|uniref:Uncharacterized protein n=1 Tax=Meiothermus luteus TaxID=2026184 RepID=A0A399F0Y4_9DEIN|nr:hypothetical protein Mlute_00166 [Meiothermus luteus]
MRRAVSKRAMEAWVGSMGGRLRPPSRRKRAPGSSGLSALSAVSIRSASAWVQTLRSISTQASAATTLEVVPPRTTLGPRMVPFSQSCRATMRGIWWASSKMALTPFSGSTPWWAALPWAVSRYCPTPLRATFRSPLPMGGSSTSTAWLRRAASSMAALEAWEPTSSSGVKRSSSRGQPNPSSRLARRAQRSCTMPPFMS